MDYPTYQSMVVEALADLYAKVLTYLPNLIAAIIVLILGWVLATFLSKLVYKLLEMIKIDNLANQLGLKNLSDRVEKKLSLAGLGAWLVKWVFFLGSFIAAADILPRCPNCKFLHPFYKTYSGPLSLCWP